MEDDEKLVAKPITKNSIELENDGLVVIRYSGGQDKDSIADMDKRWLKIVSGLDYKPNVLMDVTNMEFPDKGAREEGKKSLDRDDYSYQAIFGMNRGLGVIANIFLQSLKLDYKTKLFSSEDEARKWLKTKKTEKK